MVKCNSVGHGRDQVVAVRSHPLGVRPSGNALTNAPRNLRAHMGNLSQLPDETLHLVLEWLDSAALIALGHTCRALFAFTSNDELWRILFVR